MLCLRVWWYGFYSYHQTPNVYLFCISTTPKSKRCALECAVHVIVECFISAQFGCFEWSHAETHLLYTAEKKRPKAKSFFDRKAAEESASKSKDELALVRIVSPSLLKQVFWDLCYCHTKRGLCWHHPSQDFVWYDTCFRIVLCCLHRLRYIVGVIPKVLHNWIYRILSEALSVQQSLLLERQWQRSVIAWHGPCLFSLVHALPRS